MNSDTTKPILPALETVCCSRCAGSGQYSRCESYGTRCFKCAGAGKVLTKRGAIARAYITSLRTKIVSASQVNVGDTVNVDGKWAKVIESVPSETLVSLKFDRKCGFYSTTECAFGKDILFKVLLAYDKDATWSAGLALQNTLSKMGKPTKATSAEHLVWIGVRKSA